MTESDLQALIMRDLTQNPHCRLWRNNSGTGWAGTLVSKSPDGTVVLRNARPLHAGLHTGSADLIGLCGPTFLSIEVKTPTGRTTPEQVNWRDQILRHGGIAGIVHSLEEARRLIIT
jgi:hypothetical protein